MSATASERPETGVVLGGGAAPALLRVSADVICLGGEFCRNLLPTPEEFGRAQKLSGKQVALATPLLTDADFPAVEALLRRFAGRVRLEVVANDLGLIRTVARKYRRRVALSLGRVLGDFLSPAPDSFLREFFRESGVTRYEADSPALLKRYAGFGLSCSYHVPFSHMGVTRFCPWEKHWTGRRCGRACAGKAKALEGRALRQKLLLLNCGYFTEGEGLPKGGRIDRVVYTPRPAA